jgi:diguanylate cyclase (GGDEF)-like protein
MEKRYLLILFVILVAISYNIIHNSKQKSIDSYILERTLLINTEYLSIYKKNKEIADLIFKTSLNKPALLKPFKERKRGSLLNKIQEDYNELKAFDVEELQFCLPNDHSFLRVHKPFKYGDDLSIDRKMIHFVNLNKKYIHGFEASKESDAFRFIYPLNLHEQYIGSVEISFDALSFIDRVKEHFDVKGELLIKKSVIDSKFLKNREKSYKESFLPKFYAKITAQNASQDDSFKDIPSKTIAKITKKLDMGIVFSHYLDKSAQLITFIPIKDPLTKDIVALFTFTTPNHFIKEKTTISNILFFTSIFVIAVVLFLIYHELKYREKLKIEVEDRTIKLQKLNAKLENLVTTDTLTGIYNRDYFYNVAKKMLSISKREKKSLSIAVINIDKFKEINDTHGHKKGDEILLSLVKLVNELIRDSDVFVRFSGDEFVLLLPGTDLNNAYTISEKIRKSILNLNMKNEDQIPYTISIGVAELSNSGEDVETILKKADVALYRAKSAGRNSVVLSSN